MAQSESESESPTITPRRTSRVNVVATSVLSRTTIGGPVRLSVIYHEEIESKYDVPPSAARYTLVRRVLCVVSLPPLMEMKVVLPTLSSNIC